MYQAMQLDTLYTYLGGGGDYLTVTNSIIIYYYYLLRLAFFALATYNIFLASFAPRKKYLFLLLHLEDLTYRLHTYIKAIWCVCVCVCASGLTHTMRSRGNNNKLC